MALPLHAPSDSVPAPAALLEMRRRTPDVVVLDLMMPVWR